MTTPTPPLIANEYLFKPIYLPQVFSREECEKVLSLGSQEAESKLERRGEAEVNYASRLSKTFLIQLNDSSQWLYEKIFNLFNLVNTKYYHFQLVSLFEVHRLEYPQGGKFAWHSDLGIGKTANRKLSLVLFLNPRDQYQGGDLVVSQYNRQPPQAQGDAILFPSYIPHEVTPVETGVRHSLVAWVYGPPFT